MITATIVVILAGVSGTALAGLGLRPRATRSFTTTGDTLAQKGWRRDLRRGNRPRGRHRRTISAALFIGAGTVAGGLPLGLAAVAGLLVVPRVRSFRQHRQHAAAIEAAYPDLVDLLVLTIRSGCSPVQAFSVVLPIAAAVVRPAVGEVVRRCAIGDRFADAVTHLQRTAPHGLGSIAQPLADALALADRHGTPLAPILDRLAHEAREQRRRQADIAARQLPIRLAFPLVGCTLPSFVLLTVVPLMAGTLSSLRGLDP